MREDPAKRQQYSQDILQLESKIFEIRSCNAKGRLIDRINTIEQEWVLANLNGAAQQIAGRLKRARWRFPSRLAEGPATWWTTSISGEHLPRRITPHLREAQKQELQAVDYVSTAISPPTTARLPSWPKLTPRYRPNPSDRGFERYNAPVGV